jgi:hypothetical protein
VFRLTFQTFLENADGYTYIYRYKDNAAASHWDQQNRTAYARVEPNGYGFVPFSVETCGRIGQPAMKLLHDLGEEAAGPGGVSRSSFVAGALRELSVGLCRGNFLAYRASLGGVSPAPAALASGLGCPCPPTAM